MILKASIYYYSCTINELHSGNGGVHTICDEQFNSQLSMFCYNNNDVPLSRDAPHAFYDNTPLHLKSVQTFSVPLSQVEHHVTNNLQVKHRE